MLRPLPTMMKIVSALTQWVRRTGQACRRMTSRRGRAPRVRIAVSGTASTVGVGIFSPWFVRGPEAGGAHDPLPGHFAAGGAVLPRARKDQAHQRNRRAPAMAPRPVAAATPSVY